MLRINADATHQTVITTFEVTPGTCEDVLDLLTSAYRDFISRQPGFVAAGLHVNDAQTRIANYSQWRAREDFQAMLRSPQMRERNRESIRCARALSRSCMTSSRVLHDR